jgi:hypothetical protein
MDVGTFVCSTSTGDEAFRTVFPLSDPTSGPNIRSAAIMSSHVTGQLANNFLSTMDRNVFVLGLSIIA